MVSNQEKVKLLRSRRTQRLENRPLWPSREHLDYLSKFFHKQRRLLYFSLACLFLQGLFEVALILISHRYLKGFSGMGMAVSVRALLILILVVALLYLGMSFGAIKSERILIIRLINDLRARWFKLFLYKRPEEYSLENKSILISKISYHLPLLSTGLANSLAGAVRWLMFVAILLFLSFVFGYKLLLFALAAIIIGLLVGAAAALISYRFVTKETTFYSQIIRLIDFNLSDWRFVKTFKREKSVMKEFDSLVDLDSYFRVRRDLWLRFSVSLVFVFLVLISFGAGTWNSRLEYFFGAASLDTRFVMIIALVYFSRLLYESLRVGLYSVPLALGLKLSVPEFAPRHLGANKELKAKSLIFSSAKTKLFKRSRSYRAFKFEFKRSERYLITGALRSGRSLLARLLTGQAVYGRRAWILKLSQKRYFYNEFFDKYGGFYYFDPKFNSERSLLETVLGKEKTAISDLDLSRASTLVNQYPELREIFGEKEDWRYRADKFCTNAKNVFLIQAIYCLLNPPYLITIDNAFLDRNDAEIKDILSLLDKLLPQTIIIVFATSENSSFNYQKTYEI
jgi:hypothetical protein